MPLPTIRATYQSRKTGKRVVVLNVARLEEKTRRNPFTVWEVGLVQLQGFHYVYSELPLAWFNAIYDKVSDSSYLPDDITIMKAKGRFAYAKVEKNEE